MNTVQETTILLVEDDPADAELALRVLDKLRLSEKITVAKDGVEALDLIFPTRPGVRLQLPKVIFLDLKLPLVDGFEVLRRIKSDERTKIIPVVILSSSRETKDIARAYELGANSFIVKPVDAELFEQTVSVMGHYWLSNNENPQFKIPIFAEARPR